MKQKEKDTYQLLRKQTKRVTLRARLTITIAVIVMISILGSMAIAELLYLAIPALRTVPDMVQINVLSIIIAVVPGQLAVRVFTGPIQALREGIQNVADGDYNVYLDVKSSAKEIQELIAGFNMMTQELQSTEILQTSFVTNASHEFKTPISAIEGYTSLLQGIDNIDPVESAYIEKILYNTRAFPVWSAIFCCCQKLKINPFIQTASNMTWMNRSGRYCFPWNPPGRRRRSTLMWICSAYPTMTVRVS